MSRIWGNTSLSRKEFEQILFRTSNALKDLYYFWKIIDIEYQLDSVLITFSNIHLRTINHVTWSLRWLQLKVMWIHCCEVSFYFYLFFGCGSSERPWLFFSMGITITNLMQIILIESTCACCDKSEYTIIIKLNSIFQHFNKRAHSYFI